MTLQDDSTLPALEQRIQTILEGIASIASDLDLYAELLGILAYALKQAQVTEALQLMASERYRHLKMTLPPGVIPAEKQAAPEYQEE